MLSVRNVVLGMSGGLDSSVAAILLKNKGLNVVGLFMKNWDLHDESGACSWEEDLEDARYVCRHLKMPLQEVNFVKEYWNDVFVRFVGEYENGVTPNPDILCNKFIKFKAFFNHAVENLKADAIATGHYAKTSFGDFLEHYEEETKVRLLVPKDRAKDQTFFLSQVSQDALKRTMFPLSGLTRAEVKQIAVDNGLEKIAKKPKSTGICFIGAKNFSKFMSEYVTPKPGKFINLMTGAVEGTHDGVHLWTLGQRSGVPSLGQALYLVKKVPRSPDIYVAYGWGHPALFHRMFVMEAPHWIAEPPDLSYKCEVDFRCQHGKPLMGCTLVELSLKTLLGSLQRPLRAITPGQYAVFYKDGECLGSAKISGLGPSEYSLGNAIPPDYKEYEEVAPEVCAAALVFLKKTSLVPRRRKGIGNYAVRSPTAVQTTQKKTVDVERKKIGSSRMREYWRRKEVKKWKEEVLEEK